MSSTQTVDGRGVDYRIRFAEIDDVAIRWTKEAIDEAKRELVKRIVDDIWATGAPQAIARELVGSEGVRALLTAIVRDVVIKEAAGKL
jgi:hypothetical protein